MNVLERARKAAMNTNLLDMPGGYRNYSPIPKYKNVPGSKVVTRLP